MKIKPEDLPVIQQLLTKLDEQRMIYGPDELASLPEGEKQWCRIYEILLANDSAKEGVMNKGSQLYCTEATHLHLVNGYYDELYNKQEEITKDQKLDRVHKKESIANMRKSYRVSIAALIISIISILISSYFAMCD